MSDRNQSALRVKVRTPWTAAVETDAVLMVDEDGAEYQWPRVIDAEILDLKWQVVFRVESAEGQRPRVTAWHVMEKRGGEEIPGDLLRPIRQGDARDEALRQMMVQVVKRVTGTRRLSDETVRRLAESNGLSEAEARRRAPVIHTWSLELADGDLSGLESRRLYRRLRGQERQVDAERVAAAYREVKSERRSAGLRGDLYQLVADRLTTEARPIGRSTVGRRLKEARALGLLQDGE